MLDCILHINEFYKLHSDELNMKIDEYFQESNEDFLTNDQAIEMLMKVFKNYSIVDDDDVLYFTLSYIVNLFDKDKNNQIDMNELITMMSSLTNMKSKFHLHSSKSQDPYIATYIKEHIDKNKILKKIKTFPLKFLENKLIQNNHPDNGVVNENINNIQSPENTYYQKQISDGSIDESYDNIGNKKENSKLTEIIKSDVNFVVDEFKQKVVNQTVQSPKKTYSQKQSYDGSIDLYHENQGVKNEYSKLTKKVEAENYNIKSNKPKGKY